MLDNRLITNHKGVKMSKTYRIRPEAVEEIKDRRIALILETKDDIKESDLIGALIWKYLSSITYKDIEKYREEVLGKD